MDNLIVILIVILLLANLAILYFQFKNKPKQEENVSEKFKDEISSIKSSFSESFGNMSRDIAKDMTGALTKVDEKVGVFNQHVEALNKGQQNFSRILAGVKQYGVLAEFSLASLLKDLLPASQYIANVKIKPEETSENVEFAARLQDGVLCPIDSHWPIEKFKAIDDAYQNKDKQMHMLMLKRPLQALFEIRLKKLHKNIFHNQKQPILQLSMHQLKVCFQSWPAIEIPILKNY